MDKINFDNTNINKQLPVLSVSTCLSLLSKPFDKDKVVNLTYNKHFNNPESKYYQKSKDEIIQMWEDKAAESCRYGSMLDDYIGINLTGNSDDLELWKLDNDYDGDERLHNNCDSFDNFISQFLSDDIKFVDREKTLYLPYEVNGKVEGYFKGRFDALFYNNKLNKYIIVDWKSSAAIDSSNRWEKLLGPCKNLDSCNHNTYTLQGYFYKTALLNSYLPKDITVDNVDFIIVQLPGHILENNDNKNFKVYTPAFEYNKDYIINMLNFAWKKNTLISK